jgi:hypothetical protein
MSSSPIGGVSVEPRALRAASLVSLLSLAKDPRDRRVSRPPARLGRPGPRSGKVRIDAGRGLR